MAIIIDREKPINKQIKEAGGEPEFLSYILDYFGVSNSIKIPDAKEKAECSRKTLFAMEIVKNTRAIDRLYFWLAVSYMADYFLENTGKPHWRLIQGFLRSKKAWGKPELKPEWHGRGKKKLENYYRPSEDCIMGGQSVSNTRVPLSQLSLLYDAYKKLKPRLEDASLTETGLRPFFSAKRVYKT